MPPKRELSQQLSPELKKAATGGCGLRALMLKRGPADGEPIEVCAVRYFVSYGGRDSDCTTEGSKYSKPFINYKGQRGRREPYCPGMHLSLEQLRNTRKLMAQQADGEGRDWYFPVENV